VKKPQEGKMKIVKSAALLLGILIASLSQSFGQTNLQFTEVAPTDEQAIRLTWASVNHEVYQIQCANALNTNANGSTAWQLLYDAYPSQGTNTFWLDTGNYNLVPQILHPKYMPMRFYRILDLGPDTTSDEPTVSISSPTNGTAVSGELTINVVAYTDQPVLSRTKLYVDGQEMQMADSTTNYAVGSTNYEVDTYSINTCEWLNGTHILFATTECESGYAIEPNSGAITSGHAVSSFVSVVFSNLVEEISFSQPTFDPSSGEIQQVSAVFAANSDWTLNIVDVYSNVVRTATGSGTSMVFNWDGTGTGETNLPNGIYYYYISAATNGGSSDVVVGGSYSGGSPPSPAIAGMSSASAASTELWAAPSDGSGTAVPFSLYPPGFDTNGLSIFEAPVAGSVAPARSLSSDVTFAAMDSGAATTPDYSGSSSQNPPAAPQRPPINPVKGFAGTFGIGYNTYAANGTNGVTAPMLQNEPGISGSYIQMESFSAGSGLTWPPRPQYISEANSFVQGMQRFGWSNPLNLADGYLNLSSLRGSGTPFNNVNMGVLILHGTYGSTQDYMAGLCKQMYFPIASGSIAQYLRFSEMNLGGAGTNGLKWMVIDACHSLYHANWSSMQSMGIKPYNGSLHLILGADTVTYTSPNKWWYFARYMNYGTSTNYSPLTIRSAWYQSAQTAFTNVTLPSGATITLAVAGDTACLNDMLQSNSPPGGIWTYDSKPVYP
jgi:hypothetical protein